MVLHISYPRSDGLRFLLEEFYNFYECIVNMFGVTGLIPLRIVFHLTYDVPAAGMNERVIEDWQ